MTQRSIRRAAERKARKNEQKNQPAHVACPLGPAASQQEPDSKQPLSPARLAANRSNARDEPAVFSEAEIQAKLAGPPPRKARAIASLNAVKTGLTGRTVLLPTEDAEDYRAHVDRFAEELKPIGTRECALVQSIADTEWRLMRVPTLELAIYARGRCEFAETFLAGDPALRASKIELETFLKYEKQLRNLQLQEGRLRRHRQKELAELKNLQQERIKERTVEKKPASGFEFSTGEIDAPGLPQVAGAPTPAAHGFVFSTATPATHLEGGLQPAWSFSSTSAASCPSLT